MHGEKEKDVTARRVDALIDVLGWRPDPPDPDVFAILVALRDLIRERTEDVNAGDS